MKYDWTGGNPLRGASPQMTLEELAATLDMPGLARGSGRPPKGFPPPTKEGRPVRYSLAQVKEWAKGPGKDFVGGTVKQRLQGLSVGDALVIHANHYNVFIRACSELPGKFKTLYETETTRRLLRME